VDSAVVREASSDELERVIAVEVLAFAADPPMRFLFPDPQAYLEHFPAFAEAFGGAAFEHGTAHVAGEFSGAAMWLPPGVHADNERIGAVVAEALDPDIAGDAFSVLKGMEDYHIEEPHWYLPMIGVDPAQQGRGIGSALLRHALAKCDEDHLPAYLESSRPENIPLYERHGFRVLGQVGGDSFPVITPMLRPAR